MRFSCCEGFVILYADVCGMMYAAGDVRVSASLMLDEGGGCGLFPSLLFELPAEPIRTEYSRLIAAASGDAGGVMQQHPALSPPAVAVHPATKPSLSSPSSELQAPCLRRLRSVPLPGPTGALPGPTGGALRSNIGLLPPSSPLLPPPPFLTHLSTAAPSLLEVRGTDLDPAQATAGDDSFKVQLKQAPSLLTASY